VADEQPPTDSGLTPEQETVVRGLLADARHDEPLPDAVAARLDRVLERLHEDREAPSSAVVDLGARRRGKAGRLLLAAAAIVVGGVAAGQVLGGGGDSDESAGPDSASVARSEVPRSEVPLSGEAAEGEDAPDAAGAAGGGAGAQEAAPTDGQLSNALPVQLSPGSFDRDVRRLARSHGVRSSLESAGNGAAVRDFVSQEPAFACAPAAYGKGTLLPAYYADQPAVLAFRPPLGSERVAELLRCGTAEKLRSLTLSR